MEESIQQLRHWSDKFLELILSSLDQIPYGMRCIAKCMYDSLTEKFPTSPEKDVLKVMFTYLLGSEVWELQKAFVNCDSGGGAVLEHCPHTTAPLRPLDRSSA